VADAVNRHLLASHAVAAAEAREPAHKPDLDTVLDQLGEDFLSAVTNQLVFSDLPKMLWPFNQGWDRGRELEEVWKEKMTLSEGADAAVCRLDRRARDLATGEWEGWRPTLIFTPMIVEDGRRLLISNLNLDFAPRNVGHMLMSTEANKLTRNSQIARALPEGFDIFSLSAVEFFRLFPDAWDFRLSTAVRMSATFPLVSPAVSLPTTPPRRVVDAGYYDNYGVNLAALWVSQNQDWLVDNTSGVVLIQVRDWQGERVRRELNSDAEDTAPPGLLARLFGANRFSGQLADGLGALSRYTGKGSEWITSPIEGVSSARYSINSFRNDEQVEALSNLFHWTQTHHPVQKGFYTTVVFECPKEASLSWAVSERESQDIRRGFRPDLNDPAFSDGARRNAERLDALEEWWKQSHD
jgi:hypothetical protein